VKADKTIRLLKTVPPLQIGFTAGADPVVQSISGQDSSGWTTVLASDSLTNQLIQLTWEDTIDISGISAADLSLINQGGALAVCRPPICTFPETGSIVFTTYVSVNPIRGTFLERYAYGNSLNSPAESQDWFLATSQTYTRDSTGAGFMSKIAENNWGTGGIASSTRLFVKCFVQIDRTALYVPADPGPGGFCLFEGQPYLINLSPTTIGMMAITAEMDAVQTAAAIYRGNDLQQTYDEP
jgi:hypothetical protein